MRLVAAAFSFKILAATDICIMNEIDDDEVNLICLQIYAPMHAAFPPSLLNFLSNMNTRQIIPYFDGFKTVELDIYHNDSFVVCTECKKCISTFNVKQHLLRVHRLDVSNKTITSLFLPFPAPLPLFREKVCNLPVNSGFICNSCNYICKTKLQMNDHIGRFHEKVNSGMSPITYQSIRHGYEEVKYQLAESDHLIYRISNNFDVRDVQVKLFSDMSIWDDEKDEVCINNAVQIAPEIQEVSKNVEYNIEDSAADITSTEVSILYVKINCAVSLAVVEVSMLEINILHRVTAAATLIEVSIHFNNFFLIFY